jgi:uncharacterized protein YqgC (DUF456 family)
MTGASSSVRCANLGGVSGLEIIVAVVIAVGVIGVVVPMLPGSLLVLVAVVVWATEMTGRSAWTVAALAGGLVVIGGVVKYLVPGRSLQRAGVPNSTLFLGAALGVVGFFVVPVIGLPLGFVLGVYVAEWRRLGHDRAWPATVQAVRAVGLGILIEFLFAFLAALVWVVGVVLT